MLYIELGVLCATRINYIGNEGLGTNRLQEANKRGCSKTVRISRKDWGDFPPSGD